MWGNFDDGSQFLMRSPLESMRESAAISNRFLIYIGCILICVAGVLVWYFSKKLTEPILELAALSDQMANLNFEAKYTGGGPNEIGGAGGKLQPDVRQAGTDDFRTEKKPITVCLRILSRKRR